MIFLNLASMVHLNETVVATLAILGWHFDSVLSDPEDCSLDLAWLPGQSVRRQAGKRPGLEEDEKAEEEGEQEQGQERAESSYSA